MTLPGVLHLVRGRARTWTSGGLWFWASPLSSCTAPPGRPSGFSRRAFRSLSPAMDDALVAGRAETQA